MHRQHGIKKNITSCMALVMVILLLTQALVSYAWAKPEETESTVLSEDLYAQTEPETEPAENTEEEPAAEPESEQASDPELESAPDPETEPEITPEAEEDVSSAEETTTETVPAEEAMSAETTEEVPTEPENEETEEAFPEPEPEEETTPAQDGEGEDYPWDGLSDVDFAAWVTNEDNKDTLIALLADSSTKEYSAFYERVSAIVDQALDAQVNEYLTELLASPETETEGDYIYFDLNAGDITITGESYTGYIFVDGKKTVVSGSNTEYKEYYIYQSNDSNRESTGLVNGEMVLPEYDAVTYEGQAWSEYITDNSSVEDVIENWKTAAAAVGRTGTAHQIKITGQPLQGYVTVVFDDLWSTYCTTGNTTNGGPVYVSPTGGTKVTIKLKGDSRFKNIYYKCTDENSGSLTITSNMGDTSYDGSMTVTALEPTMTRNGSGTDGWPDCLAVIGAAYNAEYGLTFSGGTVFAGFPAQYNRVWNERNDVAFATCVGGGNNQSGEVTITGGRLTAVSNGTSPAIGGGGGYNLTGNPGTVTISGGRVYAYSFGIYSIKDGLTGFVPTTTIGGASTFNGEAKKETTVTISGGYVYASSVGGTAIGGGGSRNGTGGDATVNITGGTVVAESVPGTVYTTQDGSETMDVSEGNAIGGGVGTTGGEATVTISGGIVAATAIGGGTGSTGNGGEATVVVTGGSTTLTGNIGGGDSQSGNGGNATIYVTGGYIHAGTIGGGSTGSKSAKIGYARAYISGGDIQGQFLLQGLENGTERDRCEFIMTGGTIHDVSATNVDYPDRKPNGGAVWMDDQYGIVTISGGTIENCDGESGGAIYMTAGTFVLTGSGRIINCSATGEGTEDSDTGRGGAVYLGGGRAIVGVERVLNSTNEKVEIVSYLGLKSTGTLTAPLTTTSVYLTTDVVSQLTCSITGCRATYGGALYVKGSSENTTYNEDESTDNKTIDPAAYSVYISGGSISSNTADSDGGGVCVNNGHVLMDGGTMEENRAVSGNGGAIYLSSQSTDDARVRIRSGIVSNNYAGASGGAIAVEGGDNTKVTLKVTVGVNLRHYAEEDTDAEELIGCDHINDGIITKDCPQLENNTAVTSGGAIHISGGSSTMLNIYCLVETGNTAQGDEEQSNFMMVEGGTVIITTGNKQENADAEEGYTDITGSIHIVGGSLDIYGRMKNPRIEDVITVDLQSSTDHFEDHRIVPDGAAPIYWVHYYENFLTTDDNGVPYRTGRFKAYPVESEDDYEHIIRSTLFNRPGYAIVGWHTTSEGVDTAEKTDNAYAVGDTYIFPYVQTHTVYTLDAAGSVIATTTGVSDLVANTDNKEKDDGQLTTLVLYAIWETSNYKIHFDANTSAYSGSMADMNCQMNVAQNLTKNGFISPGMKFTGWNTRRDGTGTSYGDEASVIDLTDEQDGTVTLYAQWTICDHLPNTSRSYTGEGDTITMCCAICGETLATAVISGEDVPYDGEAHRAVVTYSADWPTEQQTLAVTYTMAADDVWDSQDSVDDDWTESSVPIHAGHYTASISITDSEGNAAAASAEYSISQIKWPTPAQPEVDITIVENDENSVTIKSPTGENMRYQMTYTTNGTTWESGWQKDASFKFSTYNVFHYFYAKRIADRDHLESDASESLAYLSTNGIIVVFDVEPGIAVEMGPAGENNGVLEFTAQAKPGYHLREYKVSFEVAGADGTNLEMTDAVTDNVHTHTLSDLSDSRLSGVTVTIKLTGVAKDATVTAKSTPGQVFADFTGRTTMISRDSAFTARFTVSNYIPQEYESQTLTFGAALPAGATVIMKTDTGYWYYNVDKETSAISLTEFTAMGGTEKYERSYTDDQTAVQDDFWYQFVVDFSHVEENARLSAGDLTADLTLTPAENNAPAVPKTGEHQLTIGLKDAAEFAMDVTPNGTTATVSCTYTPSTGTASVWNGRKTALVLTLKTENVPPDLSLTVGVGGGTTVYTMNAQNQFIISLGALGSKAVTLTLSSAMFPENATEYAFDAAWYVSASGAASAPINGYLAASNTVTFTAQKSTTPSLRVENNNRLLYEGDKLEVTLTYQDIPTGATITAELYRKDTDTGTYVSTGFSKVETAPGEKTYTLGGQTEGSFCLRYTVMQNNVPLLRVSSYFILLPKSEK